MSCSSVGEWKWEGVGEKNNKPIASGDLSQMKVAFAAMPDDAAANTRLLLSFVKPLYGSSMP